MGDSSAHCPICAGNRTNCKFELYDDRYGFPGTFSLYQCDDCFHVFLGSKFDEKTLSGMYTDYYPRRSLSVDDYRPAPEAASCRLWLNGEYSQAYRWVPKNVRVLDIGCGFCESLGYHKNRDCDVYGVEADQNISRIASTYGFNVHTGLFDPATYEPDFFDYVTMDQVLEHVSDPIKTLKDVSQVLKPGGLAIVSTPNAHGWGAKIFNRSWINWHTPYHLHIFSLDSMKRAAKAGGLILERANTLTNSHWLYFQLIHLLIKPQQGTASCFWSPFIKKNVKAKVVIAMADVVRISRLLHMFTRLMDSAELGDNYVFFLRKK